MRGTNERPNVSGKINIDTLLFNRINLIKYIQATSTHSRLVTMITTNVDVHRERSLSRSDLKNMSKACLGALSKPIAGYYLSY